MTSRRERLDQRRIALHLPSLHAGGAERVMLNLGRGLAELGIRVDLVLASASGELMSEVPDELAVVDLGVSRALFALPGLVRYLRDSRPAALLSTMAHTNVIAVAATRAARTGTRCFVRESTSLSKEWQQATPSRARLWRNLVRVAYPKSDGIIAPSAGVAADLKQILRQPVRIDVIPNPTVTPELGRLARAPVDHAFFDEHVPTFLAVGRLNQAKDYPTLLRAFALVRSRRASNLLILGEGELRAALKVEAKRLGIQDAVSFPGYESNPYAYMHRCSVFVLSSRQEGSPNSLIQALACGCRVVSTDCVSGPREILKDGRLGTLVPVGDTNALASAMLAALDAEPCTGLETELRPYFVQASARRYAERLLGTGAVTAEDL